MQTGGLDINSAGVVVGYSDTSDWTRTAVRWNANGSMTLLRPLPGVSSMEVDAINDNNVAVGVTLGGTWHAVKWAANGAPSTLFGVPGEQASRAWDINNAGVAVGYAVTSDNATHAVKWSASGRSAGCPRPASPTARRTGSTTTA